MQAIVFPTLKKPDLDANLCQNYHPLSNLSVLSKTLKRLGARTYIMYAKVIFASPAALCTFCGLPMHTYK